MSGNRNKKEVRQVFIRILLGTLLRVLIFLVAVVVVLIVAYVLFQANHVMGILTGLFGSVGAIWFLNKIMDM